MEEEKVPTNEEAKPIPPPSTSSTVPEGECTVGLNRKKNQNKKPPNHFPTSEGVSAAERVSEASRAERVNE